MATDARGVAFIKKQEGVWSAGNLGDQVEGQKDAAFFEDDACAVRLRFFDSNMCTSCFALSSSRCTIFEGSRMLSIKLESDFFGPSTFDTCFILGKNHSKHR